MAPAKSLPRERSLAGGTAADARAGSPRVTERSQGLRVARTRLSVTPLQPDGACCLAGQHPTRLRRPLDEHRDVGT